MGRSPCCDKSKVKRGPWSPEEDATLKTYLEKHGTVSNWIALPHKAGLNRCGKSCRLRWLNYLRPDIKHGGFTEEEDNVIWTLYSNIGSRWSVIASQLPGRTDNDVKNYWNTKLKKKLLASGGTSFNHNTKTKISTQGNNSGRFSGSVSKLEASDHHQWNSANCLIDQSSCAYGKNFHGGPQLEQNDFDSIIIGQFSSQPSPHVEDFDFGTNGNTISSSISPTLEVSNSSSPNLGFEFHDNNLALASSSWDIGTSIYNNLDVNSNSGEDHKILMKYMGFDSSYNDLRSGFRF